MKINTPRRVEAFDRRLTAVHEAGHLVVAAHLGFHAVSGWIEQNDPFTIISGERTWIGRVQYLTVNQMSPMQRRLIACAGAAAECCWQNESPDYDYWSDPEIMSESDWRFAQCKPGEPDFLLGTAVNKLAYLLERGTGPLWGSLILQTRVLIADARR